MAIDLRHEIRPDDRCAVEQITQSSGFFSEAEVVIALEVFDDALRSPRSGYRCVIAEQDGHVTGYAIWGKDAQTVDSYELYWIAVDNRGRGGGVGTALLHDVEQAIRAIGGGQLFIETAGRSQYEPTRRFYERHGYRVAAMLDDYFGPGDARVIFSKRL